MFYSKSRGAKLDYRGAAAPKNVRSVEITRKHVHEQEKTKVKPSHLKESRQNICPSFVLNYSLYLYSLYRFCKILNLQ